MLCLSHPVTGFAGDVGKGGAMDVVVGREARCGTVVALVSVLACGLALSGCSPSADDVTDAVGGLPGVVSAEPACHDFVCTVEIEAEPTASAEELAGMLTAARTVDDARDVELSLELDQSRRVSARLELDSAPSTEDLAVGTLLAWAAAQQGRLTLSVERGNAETVRVTGSAADDTSIWPLGRAAWPLATALRGAQLELVRPAHLRQQSLRVEDSFPDEVVSAAEELERGQEAAVTGVLLEPGRMLVGAISRDAAQRLRPVLADDPRLAGATTEVVVTDNVLLTANAVEPGTSQRLEPVLAALDGEPEVLFVTLAGDTVEAQVDGVRSFPRLVERVRRLAGDAFVDTTLVLEDRTAGHRVEITPDGDDAVLDLVLALLPSRGLRSVGVGQEQVPDPAKTAVTLSVTLHQPGPGTGVVPAVGPEVTRLARLLSTTPGSAASYWLDVTVEDADGRSADAGWRVDRTPDGLMLGEVTGTDERQAEIRAAWAKGVA